MRINKIIGIIILMVSSLNLYAQKQILLEDKILNEKNNIVFAKLDSKQKIISSTTNDLLLIKQLTNHSQNVEYRFEREYKDNNGFTHKVYLAFLNNIRVIGLDYVVHEKAQNILMANGDFSDISSVITIPSLNKEGANQKALNYFGMSKNYLNTKAENKGLVICRTNLKSQVNIFKLAFKILVENQNHIDDKYIYVDAITGEILQYELLICTTNVLGTAFTRYSGSQAFTTDFTGGQYRLREVRNGVNIITLNNNNSFDETGAAATDFWDNDNIWTSAEHGTNQIATDAHWGAEKVYDYWLSQHNRNSINNAGMDVRSYIHVRTGYDNAYWNPTSQSMYYGDGGSFFRPLTSLDVCAHELGHGICQFTSNLNYSYGSESSALNEGFSDIWGASVEAWAAPTKQRWLIGEEITLIAPFYLRSMSAPKTGAFTPSADCYGSTTWNNEPDAHYRSGVLNKWFQLLSDGGSATNDLGNAYNVNGITIDKAAKIAYLTEQLLNSSANYAMARNMSIQAATQLYGANSCEVISVTKAWYSVGVGADYITNTNITGPDPLCSNSTGVYTINGVPCNGSINWSLTNNPIGATLSTTVGNTTSVTIPTTSQNAVLLLTANISGFTTSITKQIYVGAPIFGATYKNGITDGNPVAIYFPSQGSNNLFNNVCIGYGGVPNVYIDGQPTGANSINWSVPDGYATTAFSLYTGYGTRAYFAWNYGGTTPPGYIQASVSNGCGTYSQIFAFKQVNCGTPGGDPCAVAKGTNYYTISPNPARDIIKIGITNRPPPVSCTRFKSINTSNGIIFSTVNIYNNLGTLVKSYKTKNAKAASIQIGNLIAGSYLVEIIQADYVEKQQIIVQK